MISHASLPLVRRARRRACRGRAAGRVALLATLGLAVVALAGPPPPAYEVRVGRAGLELLDPAGAHLLPLQPELVVEAGAPETRPPTVPRARRPRLRRFVALPPAEPAAANREEQLAVRACAVPIPRLQREEARPLTEMDLPLHRHELGRVLRQLFYRVAAPHPRIRMGASGDQT